LYPAQVCAIIPISRLHPFFIEQLSFAELMLSMNLMLKQMNSQVFVMALHFECNTTLVVLQVELGVVAMVLVGQVHWMKKEI